MPVKKRYNAGGTDLLCVCCVNADSLAVTGDVFKFNLTVDESEQGIVLTDTYVIAGMDMGSALSDDDVAGNDGLTVCLLHAKAFGLTVSAVLGRADSLFMCKKLKTEL